MKFLPAVVLLLALSLPVANAAPPATNPLAHLNLDCVQRNSQIHATGGGNEEHTHVLEASAKNIGTEESNPLVGIYFLSRHAVAGSAVYVNHGTSEQLNLAGGAAKKWTVEAPPMVQNLRRGTGERSAGWVIGVLEEDAAGGGVKFYPAKASSEFLMKWAKTDDFEKKRLEFEGSGGHKGKGGGKGGKKKK